MVSEFNPEVVVIGPAGGRVCIEIRILPTAEFEAGPDDIQVIDVEAEILEPVPVSGELEVRVEPDAPTPRELDVLGYIAQGYTNRQTAEALSISTRTVESHRANLMAKWGVDSRAALIREGKNRGVIQ